MRTAARYHRERYFTLPERAGEEGQSKRLGQYASSRGVPERVDDGAGRATNGHADGFPHHLARFPLGSRAALVRRKDGAAFYSEERYGDERISQLRELGFIFDVPGYTFHECIIPAMEWYRRQEGHLMMPCKYKIPEDCKDLPPQCRGMSLGMMCSQLRCEPNKYGLEENPDRREILEKMDFPFDKQDYLFRNRTYPSLLWYKEKFGHLLINTRYEMPSDDETVPEMCRGYRLGPCVNKIRVRGDYVRDSEERREMLNR